MEIDKDSFQILFASTVRALHKNAIHQFAINGIDISPEQLYILRLLSDKEDSIQTEIAESMQVDKSAILRQIDVLEARGLLKRINDDMDRRKKKIVITDLGLAEIERAEVMQEQMVSQIFKDISLAEIEIFKQVLRKLKNNSELKFDKIVD